MFWGVHKCSNSLPYYTKASKCSDFSENMARNPITPSKRSRLFKGQEPVLLLFFSHSERLEHLNLFSTDLEIMKTLVD